MSEFPQQNKAFCIIHVTKHVTLCAKCKAISDEGSWKSHHCLLLYYTNLQLHLESINFSSLLCISDFKQPCLICKPAPLCTYLCNPITNFLFLYCTQYIVPFKILVHISENKILFKSWMQLIIRSSFHFKLGRFLCNQFITQPLTPH